MEQLVEILFRGRDKGLLSFHKEPGSPVSVLRPPFPV